MMIEIELLAAVIEYAGMLLVLSAFFLSRNNRKLITTLVVCVSASVHICLSVFAPTLPQLPRTVLLLVNFYLVSCVRFQGSFLKKILAVLLYWALAYTIDFSVLTLESAIAGKPAETVLFQEFIYLFGVLCSRSLLLMISLSCGHFARRQRHQREFGKSGTLWTVLLLIPLYTIVGMGALFNSTMAGGALSGGIVALSGGLLCVNLILCLVINKLEQSQFVEEENRILHSEATHNLELAKTYHDFFAQQRKITHEFRNQMDVIGDLLAQGEYNRTKDYIQHLRCSIQEFVPWVHTNHPMVDAVLNQKYQEAVRKGISVMVSCNDLSEVPLEDSD